LGSWVEGGGEGQGERGKPSCTGKRERQPRFVTLSRERRGGLRKETTEKENSWLHHNAVRHESIPHLRETHQREIKTSEPGIQEGLGRKDYASQTSLTC